MIKTLRARWRQKQRTIAFPQGEPVLPELFRGRPEIDGSRCAKGCDACAQSCPTGAIQTGESGAQIDLGRCLFCLDCESACAPGAIHFTREYRLATAKREDLTVGGDIKSLGRAFNRRVQNLFGRSLKLRQVSAGGCNACEADVNVLNTIVFDLGRFGIQFVASPRHADGLLITGPVTQNMREALENTYLAVPAPRLVIAVGGCAIAGGPFADNPEVTNGAPATVPVNLFIPGCPPHPITILDGLLRLVGQIEENGDDWKKI
jgi:Ni,Fe-hydrogenase III small subunit/ferredoxin